MAITFHSHVDSTITVAVQRTDSEDRSLPATLVSACIRPGTPSLGVSWLVSLLSHLGVIVSWFTWWNLKGINQESANATRD